MVIRTRSKTVSGGVGDIKEDTQQPTPKGQTTEFEITLGVERGTRTDESEVYIKKEIIENSILNAQTESEKLVVATNRDEESPGGKGEKQYYLHKEVEQSIDQDNTGRDYTDRVTLAQGKRRLHSSRVPKQRKKYFQDIKLYTQTLRKFGSSGENIVEKANHDTVQDEPEKDTSPPESRDTINSCKEVNDSGKLPLYTQRSIGNEMEKAEQIQTIRLKKEKTTDETV